jgi:hypothetical protein
LVPFQKWSRSEPSFLQSCFEEIPCRSKVSMRVDF